MIFFNSQKYNNNNKTKQRDNAFMQFKIMLNIKTLSYF
jgi:hypothetical protein